MTIASLRKTAFFVLATLLVTVTTATAEFKDGNKQLGITPGGKAAFIDYNNDGAHLLRERIVLAIVNNTNVVVCTMTEAARDGLLSCQAPFEVLSSNEK